MPKLTLNLTIFFTFLLKLKLYFKKSVNQQEVLTSGGWFVGIRHFTPHCMGKKIFFWLTTFGLKALSHVAKKFWPWQVITLKENNCYICLHTCPPSPDNDKKSTNAKLFTWWNDFSCWRNQMAALGTAFCHLIVSTFPLKASISFRTSQNCSLIFVSHCYYLFYSQ